MAVSFRLKGHYNKIHRFFKNAKSAKYRKRIDEAGQNGTERLKAMTPRRTGKTAESWSYYVDNQGKAGTSVDWVNSNIVNGISIAFILQNGHVTKNGGYFPGIDYINPALQPVYDELAEKVWKEVKRS